VCFKECSVFQVDHGYNQSADSSTGLDADWPLIRC
jgi:hypothetical protein